MVAKEIKSLQHPIVKHLVKLRKEKKYRQETGALLLEGKKMICEYRGEIDLLLTTKQISTFSHLCPKSHFVVPDEVIKKITGTSSPEPFLAQVPLPPPENLDGKTCLLALDKVRDPGNLGTLIRTALAFGFEGIFLINCADPFSPKALRAAKGATFHLPIELGNEQNLLQVIERNNLTPYIADVNGKASSMLLPLVLILGNETHGPCDLLKNSGETIAITTSPQTESLNVAVAGGILMNKIREMQCLDSMTI